MAVRTCKKCGEDNNEHLQICSNCGASLKDCSLNGVSESKKIDLSIGRDESRSEVKSLTGISGWLALLGLQILFIGVYTVTYFINTYRISQIVKIEGLLMATLIFNIVTFGLSIASLILFYKNKKITKVCIIAMLVTSFVGYFLQYYNISVETGFFMPNSLMYLLYKNIYQGFVRSFLSLVLWVPYLCLSKRVRNTLIY